MSDDVWTPTVDREFLRTVCDLLGVDPARVTRITIYPDSVDIVDERKVVDRLGGSPEVTR